jgi:hypothetical protein
MGGGCKKSPPPTSLSQPASPETVARIRWLGKQRLAADTNAASLMDIWNLPQSRNVERLMLDRMAVGLVTTNNVLAITNELSGAFLQFLATNKVAAVTNYYQSRVTGLPALLRPLLQDLIDQESFTEVRQATNQAAQVVLAVRLNAQRARFWETNLAAVLEAVSGARVGSPSDRSNGWTLHLPASASGAAKDRPSCVELARAGDWTVIGLGQATNGLMSDLVSSIQGTGVPFARQPRDFWLFAEGDLVRAAKALSLDWDLPADLPRLLLAVTGDGDSVRTRVQLDFPKPLPPELPQWNIPTNLIHDPLAGFTAIRGTSPWLSSRKLWTDNLSGAPPNQVFFWAEDGLPFLSFCAARLPDASNQLAHLADRLVKEANPWIATNSLGSIARSTNGNGVIWKDLPLMAPFVETVPGAANDLVYGGFVRELSTNRAPAGLFLQFNNSTNLVAYDWEITGARVVQWLFFGQFFRFFLDRGQLPDTSAVVAWIIAMEYRLGNCGTVVNRIGPAQLSVTRQSSIGLSSVELHLLADWLESPQFPRGLNTLLGKPTPLPFGRQRQQPAGGMATNSVPTK